jgi:hypothetical protein
MGPFTSGAFTASATWSWLASEPRLAIHRACVELDYLTAAALPFASQMQYGVRETTGYDIVSGCVRLKLLRGSRCGVAERFSGS